MPYTKQNARFPQVSIVTTFTNGTPNAIAVKVDAFAENVLVNDADAADVVGKNAFRQISFDMLDPLLTNVNVTAAGVTTTVPKIAALLRQLIIDRGNAQGVT